MKLFGNSKSPKAVHTEPEREREPEVLEASAEPETSAPLQSTPEPPRSPEPAPIY